MPTLTQVTSPAEGELDIASQNIVPFSVEDARQRTLQQGFLTKSNKLVWGLSCQSFPAWLFVLNSSNCREIHIRDFTSSEQFLASCNNSIIVSQALAGLGVDTIKFLGSDSSKVNFNLVSGDLDYLRATSRTLASSPALYLLVYSLAAFSYCSSALQWDYLEKICPNCIWWRCKLAFIMWFSRSISPHHHKQLVAIHWSFFVSFCLTSGN